MKKFVLILLTLFFITGCTIEKINKEDYLKESDAKLFSKEYASIGIKEDNPYRYKTPKEIIDILEKGTGIIYFGFPECPWCRQAVPELTRAAKEMDIKEIYYLNPKDIRDKNTTEYQKIVHLLKDYLKEDEKGNKRLYVPDVYFVSDGEIVGHHFKTLDVQINPTTSPLNDKEKDELKDIYKKLISKTYNIECEC